MSTSPTAAACSCASATGYSPIIFEASPADYRSGIDDLIKAQALFPGWLDQLLTTPIRGLERYGEMIRALTDDADAIKVYVEVNGPS